jgi:hypothetical protein
MAIDPKMQQQIAKVAIAIVTLAMMGYGFTEDQMAPIVGGLGFLFTGVFAYYTQSPKKE